MLNDIDPVSHFAMDPNKKMKSTFLENQFKSQNLKAPINYSNTNYFIDQKEKRFSTTYLSEFYPKEKISYKS